MQTLSLEGPVGDSLADRLKVAFPRLTNEEHKKICKWIIEHRELLLGNARNLPPASFSGGQPLQALLCCLQPLMPTLERELLVALCVALHYSILSLTFVPHNKDGITIELEIMEDW